MLREFAEQFDGEEPLRPELREHIDDAMARSLATAEGLKAYVGAGWSLPDDFDGALAAIRALIERQLG